MIVCSEQRLLFIHSIYYKNTINENNMHYKNILSIKVKIIQDIIVPIV